MVRIQDAYSFEILLRDRKQKLRRGLHWLESCISHCMEEIINAPPRTHLLEMFGINVSFESKNDARGMANRIKTPIRNWRGPIDRLSIHWRKWMFLHLFNVCVTEILKKWEIYNFFYLGRDLYFFAKNKIIFIISS